MLIIFNYIPEHLLQKTGQFVFYSLESLFPVEEMLLFHLSHQALGVGYRSRGCEDKLSFHISEKGFTMKITFLTSHMRVIFFENNRKCA